MQPGETPSEEDLYQQSSGRCSLYTCPMSFTFTFVKIRKGELNDNLLSITFFAVRTLYETWTRLDSFVADDQSLCISNMEVSLEAI